MNRFEIKVLMTRGETIKEEKVKSLTRNTIPNTMVLENYEPFPGYYGGNLPPDIRPMSVFIVLEKKYDPVRLSRIMKEISKRRKHACDGTTATIEIRKTKYFCLRIKNLDCFMDIMIIQENFKEEDIGFMAYRNIDETVLIHVQKTFLVEKTDNNIYRDIQEESQFYFPLGKSVSWEQFRELTSMVKNNIANNVFDAALSFFWTLEGIEDMVRIYDKNNSQERMNQLMKYYLRNLKRI